MCVYIFVHIFVYYFVYIVVYTYAYAYLYIYMYIHMYTCPGSPRLLASHWHPSSTFPSLSKLVLVLSQVVPDRPTLMNSPKTYVALLSLL